MDSFPKIQTNPISKLIGKYPVILQLLRFAAIGFLNTGLSFIIANLISKYFGVVQGNSLGYSSAVGFLLATLQSYFWNKYWAFGDQNTAVLQNVLRLIWVGLVGVLGLLFVYVGARGAAAFYYYVVLLAIFLLAEFVIWRAYGLAGKTGGQNLALAFFIVSLIGFLINFFISSRFSEAVHIIANPDLNKNLALVVATAVSLIWNFAGYKIFVFKK